MNSNHTHNPLLRGACAGLVAVAACAAVADVPWVMPTTGDSQSTRTKPVAFPTATSGLVQTEKKESPTPCPLPLGGGSASVSGDPDAMTSTMPAPAATAPAVSANEAKPLPQPKARPTTAVGEIGAQSLRDTKAGAASPAAWSDLVSVALPLAMVVGLVLVCAAVLKRVAGKRGGLVGAISGCGAPGGIVEVLGRYPISRAQALVLLRVDRRVLLLSHAAGGGRSGPGGFTTLSQFDDAEDVASILAKVNDAGTGGGAKTANARFHAALKLFERQGQDERGEALSLATAHAVAGRRVVHGERVRGPAHPTEVEGAATAGGVGGPTDRVSLWDEHVARLPAAVSPVRESEDLAAGVRARLAALRGRSALGSMMGGGA